ncbi:hypothetical protein [Gracilibacillus alcaliphilus]|uniref:hypothetical protein n=1 Tax=Gracilibacillus alcaliphilus TaxID=1401441 RepID=UPI00195D662A|nr:hypothetical protein [Gracilibacillus alcaliphilus]MBM7675502.1 hypothetical protein [Gracilibacillus alcaliphilus]
MLTINKLQTESLFRLQLFEVGNYIQCQPLGVISEILSVEGSESRAIAVADHLALSNDILSLCGHGLLDVSFTG